MADINNNNLAVHADAQNNTTNAWMNKGFDSTGIQITAGSENSKNSRSNTKSVQGVGSSNTDNQSDPWQQWQKDEDQYNKDVQQSNTDNNTLQTELQNLKGMDPQDAYMYIITTIFPQLMTTNEDQVQVLSDATNISSDYQNQYSQIQQEYNSMVANSGGNVTADDMTKFANDIDQMQNEINSDPSLDANTKNNMNKSLNDIRSQFTQPDGTPDWTETINTQTGQVTYQFNADNMAADVKNWYTLTPDKGVPSQITAISTDLNNVNQSISSVSTTLQTQITWWTNMYNSYQSAYQNVLSGTGSLESTVVGNSKASL